VHAVSVRGEPYCAATVAARRQSGFATVLRASARGVLPARMLQKRVSGASGIGGVSNNCGCAKQVSLWTPFHINAKKTLGAALVQYGFGSKVSCVHGSFTLIITLLYIPGFIEEIELSV